VNSRSLPTKGVAILLATRRVEILSLR
jgi:hypothetical protein